MDGALLHVVTACPCTQAQVSQVLRALRRCAPRTGAADRTLLLLCDLPDAEAARLPEDDALLRPLQSGVMAMDARAPGRFLLLVRRRVWDDAARLYLGRTQAQDPRRVIAGLLLEGKTQAAFDAATFSPASLRGKYAAVLFSPLSLTCTPDTPKRMRHALEHASGCVCARVLIQSAYPQSALSRLMRTGFSLSAAACAQSDAALRRGESPVGRHTPALYTPVGLAAHLASPDACAPLAKDCYFVRTEAVTLRALLDAQRSRCLHGPLPPALLPPVQLALLFAAAGLGRGVLAAAALLLPEAWALLHPRSLPGALVRTALLPLTAVVSLNALLERALARSPRIRLYLPDGLASAAGCAGFGAALLLLSAAGAQALAGLLPVSLLWMAAPLLIPALASPTMERIPLDAEQTSRLLAMAETAFFDAYPQASPAPRAMLAACAGCMLHLLEPDEAARRVQALLERATSAQSAADQAAMLVSAQYLRERMAECDAALRPLPAQIEERVRTLPLPPRTGPLGVFLAAARREDASPAVKADSPGEGSPLDALFLPLGPARAAAQHALTLPLTHPHTYLRRLSPDAQTPAQQAPDDAVDRFLALAAAALGHPFYPLLMRSPIAAPYAPLLSLPTA